MRKRYLLIIAVVIAGIGCWIILRSKPNPIIERQTASKPTANSSAGTTQSLSRMQTSLPLVRNGGVGSNSENAVMQYVRNKLEDSKYDWKQPINFYGKVVDENRLPIAGADAHFKWTDLSEDGTSEAGATSDGRGLFSLINRTGKRMSVTVSKEGYYTTPSERLSSYEYANPADGLFSPNSNNPVIFHLRKKGVGTDLITSQKGVKPYLGITIPLDGTPVLVDLPERMTGQGGQLIISQKKPTYERWKQATEWSFRMEIPNGGFIEENEEFPFEAPEDGYQQVIEFQFHKDGTNWADDIRKDYYIKYGDPSRYGRLHLETSIMMSGARLTYAINPDGSRHLEPK